MLVGKLKVFSLGEWGSILTAAVSIVAALIFTATTFIEFVDTRSQLKEFTRAALDPLSFAPDRVDEFEKLKNAVASISKTIGTIQGDDGSSPQPVQLASLESKIDALGARLNILESSISNSPERALAVPMLRKDHDALAKQVNDSAVALKLEYDRLWGILMLILTVAGTAVLGVGGWVFKSLITHPSRSSGE